MHKIWLVDDDKVFHFVLNRFLTELDLGYELTVISGGLEFLNAVNQVPTSLFPSLILLDLNMPGMSGWDVLQQLNETHGSTWTVPIVVFTSSIDPVDIIRSRNTPLVSGYFAKPITMDSLTELLRNHQAKKI